MRHLFSLLCLAFIGIACDLQEIPDEAVFEIKFDCAAIGGHPIDACPFPCFISFNNTSTPNSLQDFTWVFGDPARTLTGMRNPDEPVEFADTGTYIVSLIANLSSGPSAPFTKVINVIDPVAEPDPAFSVQNDGCFAPCTVVFNNESVSSTIEELEWDFGDGLTPERTSGLVGQVSHEFAKAGIYTVRLTGFNGDKETTVEKQVIVSIRTFPASESNLGPAKAVFQMSDQSYLMVGRVNSTSQAYVLRTVAGGAKEVRVGFPKILSFSAGFEEVADAVLLQNGNIAILGTSTDPDTDLQRMVYARIDDMGEEEVPAKFIFDGSTHHISGVRIKETAGQDIFLLGTATNPSDNDKNVYTKRIDQDGINGPASNFISAPGTDRLQANDAVLAGSGWAIVADRSGAAFSGSLIMTDNNGAIIDSSFPRDLDANHGATFSVIAKPNGNLLICGLTQSLQVYLAEYPANSSGSAIWSSIAQANGFVRQIKVSTDGQDYVLFGRFGNEASIVGLNGNGLITMPLVTHGSISDSQFLAGTPTIDCGWIAVGYSATVTNLFYTKLDSQGEI